MGKKGVLVAVRPENIIEARFSLTAKQNDILDMVFSQLQDDDQTDYIIDINKYKKLYNTNTSNVYRDLEKAVESFEGKGLTLAKANSRGKVYFAWFSKIDYMPNEGKIAVRMDKELKQLFIEVKKRIYYHIKYTLNFSCIYSKRLYYYLKSFEDTGWRIDNLDTLRQKLQCPASYSKYGLFRTNVIEPAYTEINGNSDISFEFEEIKTGRKVTGLKFYITKNNNSEIAIDKIEDESDNDFPGIDAILAMITENIGSLDAKKILDSAKGDVELVRDKYKIAQKQGGIENIVAWMIGAIKGDYKPGVGKQKTSTFNDYEQRQYDFDKLEKALVWGVQPEEGESLLKE